MLSKKQRTLLGKIYDKKRGSYFKMQYSKSLANKTLAEYKHKYCNYPNAVIGMGNVFAE